MLKISLFFIFILNSAFALVDYTEQETSNIPMVQAQGGPVSAKAPRQIRRFNRKTTSKRKGGLIQSFRFGTAVEAIKVNYKGFDRKITRYIVNTQIQTAFNVFTNINYWRASTDSSVISKKSSDQKGNPTWKLGFNWLRFGKKEEITTIDIYGGLMFKSDNSSFASSRMDKIVNIETSKRFYELALALAYEFRVTGTPSREGELPVGNMNKISAAIGWRVSNDINISLEGVYNKIRGNNSGIEGSILNQGFTFGYITPKLNLLLGEYIGIELGALFRTNKISTNSEILKAYLWDIEGLFGNSIFSGITILF